MKWFNDDKRADLIFRMVGNKGHQCMSDETNIVQLIPINLPNLTNLILILLFTISLAFFILIFEIFNNSE